MREYFRELGPGFLAIAVIALIVAGPATAETLPIPVVHLTLDNNVLNTGSGGSAYNGTLVQGTATGSSSYYEAGVPQLGDDGIRLQNNGDNHKTNGHYVSVPYTLPDDGTIAFWVKPDALTWNYMQMFDNSLNGNVWEMWLARADTTYGQSARFRPLNAQYYLSVLPSEPDGNTWYHIAVTWDRISDTQVDMACYINGVKNSVILNPDTATYATWTDPGTTFYLGGGNDLNEYAVATFDDLRIYNQTLSPAQVATLAQIPEPSVAFLLMSGLVVLGLRRKVTA